MVNIITNVLGCIVIHQSAAGWGGIANPDITSLTSVVLRACPGTVLTKRILPAIRGFVQTLVDGWGKPTVGEDDGVRSLQFNDGAVQSAMRVPEPKERALLPAVGTPDREGTNPKHALSAGSDVGGKKHAAARGAGWLIML